MIARGLDCLKVETEPPEKRTCPICRYDPGERQYEPAHDIVLAEGGLLRRLLGRERTRVNSVHGQGIDRLGEGLTVEAVAPDGLVEAISVTAARAFSVGVRWHAEWGHWKDDLSRVLFSAFGEAAGRRHREKG